MSFKICVCGWHFDDDAYAHLYRLNDRWPVQIVAHREHELLRVCDLPFVVTDNEGLEFGAYDYYLRHLWDGESPMVFMHDDFKLHPILRDNEIMPGEYAFETFERLMDLWDQAYVFRNRREDVWGNGIHGRLWWGSPRLLSWLKDNGGIWSKTDNGSHYNAPLEQFDDRLVKAQADGLLVRKKVYIPAIEFAYRGEFNFEQKLTFWRNQDEQGKPSNPVL